MNCLSFGKVFNCKSVFQDFYQKCFLGTFLSILKIPSPLPPPQYICVHLRVQIALSLFEDYTEQKVNVYNVCSMHILELELINLDFPLLFWDIEWKMRSNVWSWLLCTVVLKEKIVPFVKTLFMGGGGHSWGHSKNLMSLGGQEENVSSKENSPGVVFICVSRTNASFPTRPFVPFSALPLCLFFMVRLNVTAMCQYVSPVQMRHFPPDHLCPSAPCFSASFSSPFLPFSALPLCLFFMVWLNVTAMCNMRLRIWKLCLTRGQCSTKWFLVSVQIM